MREYSGYVVTIIVTLLFGAVACVRISMFVHKCRYACMCLCVHVCMEAYAHIHVHVCAVVLLHTSIATTSPSTALFTHSRPALQVKERENVVVVNEWMGLVIKHKSIPLLPLLQLLMLPTIVNFLLYSVRLRQSYSHHSCLRYYFLHSKLNFTVSSSLF